MNRMEMYEILDIQERAMQDASYSLLYREYALAQENLLQLLRTMDDGQRTVIEEYLHTAVKLHHRLLVLASQK